MNWLPTTSPGPYSLNLYTDNSVITLQARQSGASTSFAYNWLSACSSSTANTPPTVASPVPPQSATVNISYTLSLATVFTDAQTPNGLVLSVSGLPAGLNFVAPSTISGTPSMSGVSTVTVTATDPGSLSASTSFTLTVNPAAGTPPPPTGTFSITSVQTIRCEVLSAGERRLTFNPQYAGLNGAPVSFSVVNELAPTTVPGPYTLNLYTDNSVVTLRAVQSGIASSFAYNWLSACSASTANTPPTVASPVPPQTATVGVGYTLSLANVFTDAETPNQLALVSEWSASGAELRGPFDHLGYALDEWGEHGERDGDRSGEYECQHQLHPDGESGGRYSTTNGYLQHYGGSNHQLPGALSWSASGDVQSPVCGPERHTGKLLGG